MRVWHFISGLEKSPKFLFKTFQEKQKNWLCCDMPVLKAKECCLTWLTLLIFFWEKYCYFITLSNGLFFQLGNFSFWTTVHKSQVRQFFSNRADFLTHAFCVCVCVTKFWDRWLSTWRRTRIPNLGDISTMSSVIFQHKPIDSWVRWFLRVY